MNAKILMLLSNAFDPDPRVHQEAVSLAQNGYDVQLLCWDREGKSAQENNWGRGWLAPLSG